MVVKGNRLRQKLEENKREYTLLSIVLLIFFILIFVLNKLYPLYADDWGYIYAGKSFTEAVDISFQKLYNQYFTWGGRMVVHAIAHFLSWLGLTLGDLINSLVFVFFIYIIYRMCNRGNKTNVGLLLSIGIYLWLIIPAFNSTVLWLVGAANYMWGALIVILFLSAYYTYYMDGKEKKSWLFVPFFFIAGVISGWTNENLFAAQLFFIVCLFILLKKEKIKIPTWAIAGLIGVCIGGLFMILAPGNYLRGEVVKESLNLTDKNTIELILYRVLKVGYRYAVYILPAVAVYFIIFFFYRKQPQIRNRKILLSSLLFFATGNVACFAMMASYIFPPRAIFGIMIFVVIATGILYANMSIESVKMKRIRAIAVSIMLVLFVVNYGFDYKNIHYLSDKFSKRNLQLEKQKGAGNNFIIFEGEIKLPAKYDFEDLSDNPSHWLNKGFSKYYNVDSVKVIK